jgi:hypothetical protein
MLPLKKRDAVFTNDADESVGYGAAQAAVVKLIRTTTRK